MTIKTAELAAELRKIVTRMQDSNYPFTKNEINELLLTTRQRVSEGWDIGIAVDFLGGDAVSLKLQKLKISPEGGKLKDKSGKYYHNDPMIQEITGDLYTKVQEHSQDVSSRGTFSSMVRPNKSADEKLIAALDDVLKEKGIIITGVEIGR